jgi:shikimate kinase
LIGYRCTGKSSIGSRLAETLRLPFYDTDALIEAAAGMTIREMVDQKGWAYFRDKEKECIRRVALMTDGVVATGGGAVMDPDNAETLKKSSVMVWLTADIETILKRMAADRATAEQRPSLSDAENLRIETETILGQRQPVYRKLAGLTIDTVRCDVDEAVEEICRHLNKGAR